MTQDPAWDEVPTPDPATPVVLTQGSAGPGWLPAVVEALLATGYTHAGRHVFDGAGHMPQVTHVDEHVAVVRQHVRATTARRTA